MAEEITIDFKVNTDELTTAQEQLAKTGKIDASQFNAVSKAIKTTSTDAKGLIAEFKKVATTATQLGRSVENAFADGVQDALNEAGVSVEQFADALAQANQPTKTLKAELKELKEALASAKLNGKDVGAEFEAMRERAGQLQDAIADAGAEIKNAGSDTRGLDNVVGSISALAGGFAAVQGAAALFGEDSEDLQKTLVKVNSAMALASGIQQFYNATLKEGSLAKLADSVATGGQVAVQKIYTLVTGKATAATTAFKVALATTGIGLVVIAVLALVTALQSQEETLEDVNKLIDQQNDLLESNINVINRRTNIRVAEAKLAGAAESELVSLRGKALQQEFEATQNVINNLTRQRDALKPTSKAWFELNKEIEEAQGKQRDLGSELIVTSLEYEGQVKKEKEEAIKLIEEERKKREDAAKERAARAKELRLSELNDELAALERKLLAVDKNTQAEIDLQKKIIRQKSLIELEGDKLTANQRKLIQEQANAEQAKIQQEFNKKLTNDSLQAQISENEVLLQGIKITADERLNIQKESIMAAAQIEINEAEGNSFKIREIRAKMNNELRALDNARIQQTLGYELEQEERNTRRIRKALNDVAADRTKSASERINAVNKVAELENARIDIEIAANDKLKQSDEERIRNYERLMDKKAQITEETADKVGQIGEEENEKARELAEQRRDIILSVLSQSIDLISSLNAAASEQENQRLEAQKKEIDSLLEAGAITEKEAERRRKQIELQERQLRQRQAQREKQEAVFRAFLAIPQAFLTGLKQGGPIVGAIYAAIAAAQAAIVASRPVPKFFRGKKDNYQGPGEVGDMGPELVERNGRMELYTKPTQTYLMAKDKVYTAAETRAIMHSTKIDLNNPKGESMAFDYARLAKIMPQSNVNINIEKDFIEDSVANGFMKNKWFNNRYYYKN